MAYCFCGFARVMENRTDTNQILKIEGLRVTYQSAYPVFILLLLVYLFIMVSNIGLIALISVEKALHKPMYLFFCNLPLNDVLGTTVVVPALLKDIFREESDRYISYVACVIQAYGIHMFSTSAHTILMIMAFDRYVAICNPLRYNSIMTNKMVVKLTALAWVIAIVPVGIVLGLSIRLSHCSSTISNPFCDNASLFKLSCENLLVNQVVGLFTSVALWGTSMSCIALTYLKIAVVCVKSGNSALQSKAMKTCSTHLIVYLIILGCGMTAIILHRFPAYAELGKVASVLFYVIPCALNPIIYGLQTKEIRQWLQQIPWKRKVIPE
ncbi:olfactory receptor 146-like [Colossoma macropomum]|uniref:olfactory receptor 146-like n=1 Tax=Colossoma macropomum TaxID=42526 RepID=UPI001864E1F4|nr:olfactory receptor 146-like [Colossoma macropomum]